VQVVDRVSDLLHLDRAINQQTHVAQAKADNLNGVLCLQGIIHQDQLVKEAETVQREESWDCFGRRTVVGHFLDLEIDEDVTAGR
jgi:hypothetical protein